MHPPEQHAPSACGRRQVLTALVASAWPVALAVCVLHAEPDSGLQGGPPAQIPVFRTDAGYVEMTVVVTDGRGAFVRGLTRDDFEVFEDGRPQRLDGFSFVDLSATAGASPSAYAGAPSSLDSATSVGLRRCYLIAIDHFHLAWNQSPRLLAALKEFIEHHLQATDLASVVHLSPTPVASVFTANKNLLLAFAGVAPSGDFQRPGEPSVESFGIDGALGSAMNALAAGAAADAVQRSFDALGRSLEYFGEIQSGHRALLLFSQGVPIDPLGAVAGGSPRVREITDRANEAMRRLLAQAHRADVVIHTIDPRGLSAVDPFASGEDITRLSEWGSLRTIANQTGGQAVVGYNSFEAPFKRIVAASSQFYVLGYYTTVSGKDKKFHALSVRVRDRTLDVRTRQGFYGDGVAAPALSVVGRELAEVLAHPLPIGDQGLRLTASASAVGRASNGGIEIQLIVEIEGSGLARARNGESLPTNEVDLGYQIVDVTGRALPRTVNRVEFKATESVWTALAAHGWRYLTTLRLVPGYHQLRVAARETRGGRFGSVFLDLSVPELCREGLGFGTILLGAGTGSRVPSSGRLGPCQRP